MTHQNHSVTISSGRLTFKEWEQCAAILSAGTGRLIPESQLQVYFELLQDIPFEILKPACMRAVQEADGNWLPAVGVIRKLAAELDYGRLPSWAEEWKLVRELVARYGYMRRSAAYARMSPLTQKAVTAAGWNAICDSEDIAVQAAHFRVAYEALARQETELRRISPHLRPRLAMSPETTPRIHRENPVQAVAEDLANQLGIERRPAQTQRSA